MLGSPSRQGNFPGYVLDCSASTQDATRSLEPSAMMVRAPVSEMTSSRIDPAPLCEAPPAAWAGPDSMQALISGGADKYCTRAWIGRSSVSNRFTLEASQMLAPPRCCIWAA
jgi:hypothetical protein